MDQPNIYSQLSNTHTHTQRDGYKEKKKIEWAKKTLGPFFFLPLRLATKENKRIEAIIIICRRVCVCVIETGKIPHIFQKTIRPKTT